MDRMRRLHGRAWAPQQKEVMKIISPAEAHRYLQTRICSEVEEFWGLALNTQSELLGAECLFRGSVDACFFHPRDIFRFAYRHNASSLIVAHNHPSGNLEPSDGDREVTRQLLKAAKILQVPVVDHLILAGSQFFSFLAAGELTIGPLPDDQ